MVEKGIAGKRGKRTSGKCCCALFTIIIIFAIGAVAFVYRERIIEEYQQLNGHEESNDTSEQVENNLDETSETLSFSTLTPQESSLEPLSYELDDEDTTRFDENSDSSDQSMETGNKAPSIQESDSNESDSGDAPVTDLPMIITGVRTTTIKTDEEVTEQSEDVTKLYDGSGSASNGFVTFVKSKANRTMETDDEDYLGSDVDGSSPP